MTERKKEIAITTTNKMKNKMLYANKIRQHTEHSLQLYNHFRLSKTNNHNFCIFYKTFSEMVYIHQEIVMLNVFSMLTIHRLNHY